MGGVSRGPVTPYVVQGSLKCEEAGQWSPEGVGLWVKPLALADTVVRRGEHKEGAGEKNSQFLVQTPPLRSLRGRGTDLLAAGTHSLWLCPSKLGGQKTFTRLSCLPHLCSGTDGVVECSLPHHNMRSFLHSRYRKGGESMNRRTTWCAVTG